MRGMVLVLGLAACGAAAEVDDDTGPGGDIVVNAGADITIAWPTTRAPIAAVVDGGLPVTWSVESGPTTIAVRTDRAGQAWALALRPGTYVLRADTQDGARVGWDTVRVTVHDDTAPTTVLEQLRAMPTPVFRAGHGLPPLTRWTGTHTLAFQVELTERYHYALDLGDTSTYWATDGLPTVRAKLALKAADPARYPVSIQVNRPLIWDDAFRDALVASYPDIYLRDGAGALVAGRTWSPLAPSAAMAEVAAASTTNLATIVAAARAEGVVGDPAIDVILNGGEYGLGVWGDDDQPWASDPAVAAAMGSTSASKFALLSANKQRQEQVVTDAHTAAVPGAMYIYYPTWSVGWRERWGGWWGYAWDYETTKTLTTPADVAAPSIYYRDYPSQNTGYDGDKDSLSQLLNAAAWQQLAGRPHQYLSTCGGWPHDGRPDDEVLSPIDLYVGYLKAAYAAGVIGGIAGYFVNPGWGEEEAPLDDPAVVPNWLAQLVALGEVHAAMSHVEGLLRDGALLPGPDQHRWSETQPAYELPAMIDGVRVPGVRVVARRDAASGRALVVPWAWDGTERTVEVTLDDGPTVTLQARRAGAIYLVEADGTSTLLDLDGMHPSDTLFADE